MAGRLVAVVGPSGAGKDTLLGAARMALAEDPRFVFARRAITRPAETHSHAGAEAHLPLSEEAFAQAREAGAFALHWQAHGLHYGIPRSVEAELAEGRIVVANLSRAVLASVPAAYRLCVLLVTAPPALLAARIAGRGRETPEEIARRLQREAVLPAGLEMREVMNDATPEEGVARLLGTLRALAG
ncbi:phosphonate metabolism protein/1,5-bisphosphokinase (PRPP-forming) PhnN [Roseomonas sp. E05]|uniref:phosphonate metabolism protein/1,5-bisphosphokinase (PRPP-forming) PhnN n=1 Tax=Roseomonas sp. E05 TaxID=3046310 RepID=UPI0024BA3D7A|nr:phosphonate metabolism protein/1,5-bisphosphokinase (PRPP-forming) PhnN [Roseomonas sp. E05]MDJ0391388.1 phosphonate metabolism protein/1,5-bisphosphokinase (PRPP-forming) PhnN [Roseomonas sp. E05]